MHWIMQTLAFSCADPKGVTGGPDPLENHRAKEFLCNIGPDPLEDHKNAKPAFISL